MIKSKARYGKYIVGIILGILTLFLLPINGVSALQEVKDSTDLSKLDTYQFDLNVNNFSLESKSSAVDQFRLDNPHYLSLDGTVYNKPMENFTLKVDKNKKGDQVFENPLSLKFSNVGTVYGKQVDAYLKINRVTLHYMNNSEAEAQMNDASKKTVEFFSISELWENKSFELGNLPYVDANHNDIMSKAFWIDADVSAELRYSDGSETDLKLVMRPSDIDAVSGSLKESFYINNYTSKIDKRVMNNANVLSQVTEGSRTVWEGTRSTNGSEEENNVSGLAVRSVDNSLDFGYRSTEYSSAVFGLFVEGKIPAPKKEVNPAQAPARAGGQITYKATFKMPTPGKDIIGSLDQLDMVEKFDDRLDYQGLTVQVDGKDLTLGTDYTIETSGQTVTVKMSTAYLKDATKDIVVTYRTVTNQKVEGKTSGTIENTVTLKADNVPIPSNKVVTTLLYNQTHEFQSGTPGMELPKEVKELTPDRKSNIPNGTITSPTQPSKTEVTVPEGTWIFKGYDKNQEMIDGADVHFIGKWILRAYKSIALEKKWVGPEAESATFNLLVDEKASTDSNHTVTLTKQTGWTHTFDNLLKYDLDDGHEIEYSLAETQLNHYDSQVAGDANSGFVVTNTNTETINLKVNKEWVGPRKDSVTVELVTDGSDSGKTLELNEANNWTNSFVNLPKYKADGSEIQYTVKEITLEGYTSVTTGDAANGYTITNTYVPAQPISVNLTAKKELIGKALLADQYEFIVRDEQGQEVTRAKNAQDGSIHFPAINYDESQVGTHKYTIEEIAGSEKGISYDSKKLAVEVKVEKASATELKASISTASDLVFTNTYIPDKTQIHVRKVWDDADNQDGKRPTSVSVKLLADGSDTGKVLELNDANNWMADFTDLDADKAGIPIDYKVVEAGQVNGYTTTISGDVNSGFTITNKYVPETIDLTVNKNWDDANNQDGIRPKEIKVHLLADGQEVDSTSIQADANGKWSTTFTNKAKYKNGKEIKYTLMEEAVSEYSSLIDDFTITNSYKPKVVDYEVTKKWEDANNQDGIRPSKITVHLIKTVDGVETELATQEIREANGWEHHFTNLPKYEAGKEITYSVKEDKVEGYDTLVNGKEITNTHTPEMIKISGSKVWDDADNQDGKRPKEITLEIRKKGSDVVVESIKVTPDEKGSWNFTSQDLPKYENGEEIVYEVREVKVKEYTTVIEERTNQKGQYTVTNKYTPEKIRISGQKIWDDANNQDGIRPESITVHLLEDGFDTGKVARATEASNWTYSFEEIDRYKDGKEINYTVKEDKIDGYETVINGLTIINSHKPKELEDDPSSPAKPKQEKRILPRTGMVEDFVTTILGIFALSGVIYLTGKNAA